jgi:hypothetical protein
MSAFPRLRSIFALQQNFVMCQEATSTALSSAESRIEKLERGSRCGVREPQCRYQRPSQRRLLEISATVDAEGLQTLKEMLGKYEEILKLMEKSAANKPLPPLPC